MERFITFKDAVVFLHSPRALLPRQAPVDQCAAASRSAAEAVRQASQSASQAVQQATQSASQQVQQATISASNAIRDAQNSASQAVAQASRSSSSISSSASSAMASVQSSAEQAILSAKSDASRAMFKANLAIAAVTASNGAALSSILDQLPRMTGVRAESDTANQFVESANISVTATQAALAIIGSILASLFTCCLGFWLLYRYRRKYAADPGAIRRQSWSSGALGQNVMHKYSGSDSSANPTILEKVQQTHVLDMQIADPSTHATGYNASETTRIKELPWLARQKPLSSFGSIRLSVNDKDKSLPLGGQLRSPLTSTHPPSPTSSSPPSKKQAIKRNQSPVYSPFPTDRNFQAYPKLKIRGVSAPKNAPAVSATSSKPPVKRREVAPFIEESTRVSYERARANVWDVDSPRSYGPTKQDVMNDGLTGKLEGGQRSNEEAEGTARVRTTMLEMPRTHREMEEVIRTPDTATLRTMKLGTAMQGRMVLPSKLRNSREVE